MKAINQTTTYSTNVLKNQFDLCGLPYQMQHYDNIKQNSAITCSQVKSMTQ